MTLKTFDRTTGGVRTWSHRNTGRTVLDHPHRVMINDVSQSPINTTTFLVDPASGFSRFRLLFASTGSWGPAALARWAIAQNFGWVGHNAYIPTNNWPACCKIGAKRCQISRLKCTKFAFPLGEITALPKPALAVFKGPTSKGREEKERGKVEEVKER